MSSHSTCDGRIREKMLLGQVEHAGDHGGGLHGVRGSQGTELAASTLLVLDWSYFSGEAHLGYHQDTHLGARGALSTLRVLSWSEKTGDKARKFMGKPACTVVRPCVRQRIWRIARRRIGWVSKVARVLHVVSW